jgi:uncharacterized protein YmfQ (DUF2313 family)
MDDIKLKIRSLLPEGIFWQGKNFLKLIDGIGAAFNNVLKCTDDILIETFPLTAIQTIEDWEATFLIIPASNDIEQRRNSLVAKLVATGGNTLEYFLILSKALDKDSNILKSNGEYFRAGFSRAGESLGYAINDEYRVIFVFSNSKNKSLIVETLEYSRPAHLLFTYKFRS